MKYKNGNVLLDIILFIKKCFRRNESFSEYDEKGNPIYVRTSNGYEVWYENTYNEKGNLIHIKTSDGNEKWYEHDENGNIAYSKNAVGFEEWFKYNDKGILIHYKNSNGIIIDYTKKD